MFLTFGGVTIYITTFFLAWEARRHGVKARRVTFETQQWTLIAVFFAGLAIARFVGVEEGLRTVFRDALEQGGGYANRRELQAPLAAIALLGACGALLMAIQRWRPLRSRLERSIRIARLGVAAMLTLIILRIISFHPVDDLLYRGPHLNWIIDVGASLIVAGAAVYYTRILKAPRRHAQ